MAMPAGSKSAKEGESPAAVEPTTNATTSVAIPSKINETTSSNATMSQLPSHMVASKSSKDNMALLNETAMNELPKAGKSLKEAPADIPSANSSLSSPGSKSLKEHPAGVLSDNSTLSSATPLPKSGKLFQGIEAIASKASKETTMAMPAGSKSDKDGAMTSSVGGGKSSKDGPVTVTASTSKPPPNFGNTTTQPTKPLSIAGNATNATLGTPEVANFHSKSHKYSSYYQPKSSKMYYGRDEANIHMNETSNINSTNPSKMEDNATNITLGTPGVASFHSKSHKYSSYYQPKSSKSYCVHCHEANMHMNETSNINSTNPSNMEVNATNSTLGYPYMSKTSKMAKAHHITEMGGLMSNATSLSSTVTSAAAVLESLPTSANIASPIVPATGKPSPNSAQAVPGLKDPSKLDPTQMPTRSRPDHSDEDIDSTLI